LHPSSLSKFTFSGPPSKKGSRTLIYDSKRVVVGVVVPSPTFISQHTCIVNKIFSPVVTRGTCIPPDTHFIFSGPPSKKGPEL
jgi:hypothetical protein